MSNDGFQFTIRELTEADYEPIIAVLDEWWGGRRMADMLPRLFFTHFRNTSHAAIAADGTLTGFLVGFRSATLPHVAYIHFVGVSPDHRKMNIGAVLYRTFFDQMAALGCTEVHAVTSPVNSTSIKFHHAQGFESHGSAKNADGVAYIPDYDGPGEDRVKFTRTLP